MSEKANIYLIICIIIAMFLTGCTNNAQKQNNLDQLSRVDVEIVKSDGNYGEAVMIVDKGTIDALRSIFKKIQWEPNVEAKMARKEDVKATLFFKYDKNMPERLVEYQIWFNQSNDTATIISNDKNEGLGTLDKEYAQTLRGILLE